MATVETLAVTQAPRAATMASAESPAPAAPHVSIDDGQCVGCGICADVCTSGALTLPRASVYPEWKPEKCTACGHCQHECPTGAIEVSGEAPAAA